MSVQTTVINVTAIGAALASAFIASKYTEYIFMSKTTKEFAEKLNSLSSDAKLRWEKENTALKTEIATLYEAIMNMKSSENIRIQDKLKKERIHLQKSYDTAIENKTQELEVESKSFQKKLSTQLASSESLLHKVESRLKDYLDGKRELKRLENISQMIIEDDVGQFNNCYSMNALRNEFGSLLPLARHYSLFNYEKLSVFRYFTADSISKLLFIEAPSQRFDVMNELNTSVEKGDLHRALFLFNNLRGWPRLLLKDWAEKCRQRLEFVEEIKGQIYLNKM